MNVHFMGNARAGQVPAEFGAGEGWAALKTPCYLYDPEIVASAVAGLRGLIGTGLVISLKANPDPDLYVRCMHGFGDGVEVASLKELEVVAGSRVPRFVNNLSMNLDFLRAAVATRSTLILDHLGQVEMLAAQGRRNKPQPVLLRMNAGAIGVRALRQDHFGMGIADCIEAVGRLKAADVEVRGFHVYSGSNTLRHTWRNLAETVGRALSAVEAASGQAFRTVNLGGGFSAGWRDDADLIAAYASTLAGLRARYEILHESGRAVFGPSGVFFTRVVATKRIDQREIVICDGGMAQNLLLSGLTSPIRRYAQPEILLADGEARAPGALPISYVGSSCNQDDVIGQSPRGSALPRPGDLLAVRNCGAYHQTFSVVDFLGLPKAQTYIGGHPPAREAACSARP